MKSVYLDTNVLLSPFQPGDPYRSESRLVCEVGELDKHTSAVAAVELYSVVARMLRERSLELNGTVQEAIERLGFPKQVLAIVDFILSYSAVNVSAMDIVGVLETRTFSTRMPIELAEACRIGAITGLKSLDNMHLAAAEMLSKKGPKLDYFVTGDAGILRAKRLVADILGASVASPKDLVSIEGLSIST